MGTYLVIDVGTSSMRGVLYNEGGSKLHQVQLANKPTFKKGTVEQDVNDWTSKLDVIMAQITEYLARNDETLNAIFLTAQRSSLICLDRDYEPLMPAIMWQDKRSAEITAELSAHNQIVMEKTGAPLNPVYLAPKITWVERHLPEIAAQTKIYLTIADYIGFLITGEFMTDYTYASRTSLFNIHDNEWDKELLSLFGVEEGKLCDLIPAGTAGRKASKLFREKYKLENEVAFVSSGGDQQCSAIGMGVLDGHSVAVSIGTGGYVLGPIEKVVATPKLVVNTYPIESLYILEGILPACSSAIDWIRANFFGETQTDAFYELITKTIADRRETRLTFFPHFQGRGTPDWHNKARAAIIGMDFSSSKEDVLLAAIESIAIELKNNITTIEEIGRKKIRSVVVAGGLSNNKAINQLISDVLELETIKSPDSEATALGAFLIGMKALDSSVDLKQLLARTQKDNPHEKYLPNQQKFAYYREKRQVWNDLYDKMNNKKS